MAKKPAKTEASELDTLPIAELLKSRQNLRLRGLMRTMGAAGAVLDAVFPFEDTAIDEARMVVGPVVISTSDEDRYEDVVDPKGVNFDNYRINPLVMLDHGQSYAQPIGSSADENNNLMLEVTDTDISASCRFSQTTPEAYQSFGLVKEGILRGTSIHINPLVAQRRSPGTPQGGRPGFLVQESEMLEWSFGALPVNQECVAKVMRLNKIGGERICEPIRKLLMPFQPKTIRTGRGWEPTGAQPMSGTLRKTDGGDTPSMDDLQNTMPENDGDDRPYGEQVASSAHEVLKTLADQIDAAMPKMEHPEVRDHLAGLAEAVHGHMSELENCMKMYYAGSDSLKKDEEPDEDDKNKEEALQKFLRAGRVNQIRITGLGHYLKTLALARNVTTTQKQQLTRAASTIEKSMAGVKVDQQVKPGTVEMLEKFLTKLDEVDKRIDLMTPKNR